MCAVHVAWHVACGRLSPAHLTVNMHCAHTHTYTKWAGHTHYAICLCHKHIKSAIKRIGSQMRHETIRERRETVNAGQGRETSNEQRETRLKRNCHKMSNKQAILLSISHTPPPLAPCHFPHPRHIFTSPSLVVFNFHLVRFKGRARARRGAVKCAAQVRAS